MAELEVLLDAGKIARRVAELGAELDAFAAEQKAEQPILLAGVLKGACIFLADLARAMRSPAEIDFVRVASYGHSATSSGKINLSKDLETSIKGRHVVLVEDIVDTGLTLTYLRDLLQQRGPASLKTAALLDKPDRRKVPLEVDYLGFQISDRFVVGYGLDYAEQYRNLPDVCVLKP